MEINIEAPKTISSQSLEMKSEVSLGDTLNQVRDKQWGLKARLASDVSFEEYVYWAKIEREMEEVEYQQHVARLKSQTLWRRIRSFFLTKKRGVIIDSTSLAISQPPVHENSQNQEPAHFVSEGGNTASEKSHPSQPTYDYDAEWRQATRALRTAGWINVFYLITTDILGWGQTPFVFASSGWAFAITGFIVLGIAAAAAGYMIWKAFMKLDSSRYPILSFGDLFFRLYGPKTRKLINILQAFQIFCTVAVILSGSSQKLSQLANAKICYIVIVLINTVVHAFSIFLRDLKFLGIICSCGIWLNIVSFITIIAAVATHGPNVKVALQTTLLKAHEPVRTFIGVPPAQYQQQTTSTLANVFNAIDTIAYAYYGALFFVAILAEMRRPADFWKGMLFAQVFICLVYIFFGSFVYHYIGQYSIQSITQIISPHSLQVLCNSLHIVIGFLAVSLYFNVGLKVIYLEVGQEIFKLPPITQRKGYFIWILLGLTYWILAMIVAISVPNFAGITNLVSGLLIVNFTYSVPAIMFVAYLIRSYSALPGEGYNPNTGVTTRHDSGWQRHRRGLMKSLNVTVPVVIFACCGLFCSATGTWSAVLSLEQVFGPGGTIQTFWGCTAIG